MKALPKNSFTVIFPSGLKLAAARRKGCSKVRKWLGWETGMVQPVGVFLLLN
jgi:hypothetical protein